MRTLRFIRPPHKALESCPLFAIFKNGRHIGNSRGRTSLEAIQVYICDSLLEEYATDEETLSRYEAVVAIEGIHFTKSSYGIES
jgi:hypothetical protein